MIIYGIHSYDTRLVCLIIIAIIKYQEKVFKQFVCFDNQSLDCHLVVKVSPVKSGAKFYFKGAPPIPVVPGLPVEKKIVESDGK